MLARIVNMRGVDLTIFDFDYDLTWTAFFMNANQHIYGRYGGRDEGPADKGLSIDGLTFAMRAALQAYARQPDAPPRPIAKEIGRVEEFAAARRLKQDACIHCHQVYDFRREHRLREGAWTPEQIWVYPPPENVGLSLDSKQGNRVAKVLPDSAAAAVGLRSGDVLTSIGELPIASYGDVQYALHRGPQRGTLRVAWRRDEASMQGEFTLSDGWRQSDISWRGSMWSLEPQAHVYGRDLSIEEKRELGLTPNRLAFSQGNFVPPESRKAGIRARDTIIGVDGKSLDMTMLQFNVYVRLNYSIGDRITFNVIRDGQRLDVPMTLTSRVRD